MRSDLLPLDRLAGAHRFNAALFRLFQRDLGRRVLDAGAGVGTFTELILQSRPDAELVVASDVDGGVLGTLHRRFSGEPRVQVRELDLNRLPVEQLQPLRLDSALCVNVLEHIEDDAGALRALHQALVPGGRLLLLVPAHEALYGSLDLAFRHFRRYGRSQLSSLLQAAGWQVESLRPFNLPGLIGWMLSSRLLGRRTMSAWELSLFDRCLAPLLRWERRLHLPFGVSFAVIARS